MLVIAALAAFKGLSKIHTRSPCGDWMPVERPKCSPSCTWTKFARAMLSSENQGFCRSGTNQKASSEGQVEPKWRLEASLESQVESKMRFGSPIGSHFALIRHDKRPKWRLEVSSEGQVEPKWRLEASLESQVEPKWRLEASLEGQVEPK